MTEEDEIDDKYEQYDYTHIDPLSAIGFQVEPDSIYYINPPKELSTYPMYIEHPEKHDKNIGSFISYTLNGTDIVGKITRRYSDFFALYEKLVQRWPGIYIPRIPPKIITKNTSRKRVKRRMRLLNRFCLNLSEIDYLYNCDETSMFKGNNQEDAHEFIIFMIDILHEDLNKNIYKKKISENEKEEKDEQLKYGLEWKKFLLRNKSILIDLFYGQFKSKITCSICKNSVSNFYPFSTLSLNLNTEDNNNLINKINNSNNKGNNNINSNKKNINHTTSLYELFENLSSVEILSDDDKWYCKICDKKVKAFKNLEINYIPKILIIQLNRFDKYNNKIEKKNRISN